MSTVIHWGGFVAVENSSSVVIFYFAGCVCIIRSSRGFRARCPPCKTSSISIALCRTYLFPLYGLPVSSDGFHERPHGGKQQVCISRLPKLTFPRVLKCCRCPQ